MQGSTYLSACVLLHAVCKLSWSANILLMPSPFPSHWRWMAMIGKEMTLHNHTVYAVVRDSEEMVADFQQNNIHTVSYALPKDCNVSISRELEQLVIDMCQDGPPSFFDLFMTDKKTLDLFGREAEYLVRDQTVMPELRRVTFDLALVDATATNLYLFTIPHVLGVPYISCTMVYYLRLMGVPGLPSFHMQTGLPHTDQMTYPQRLFTTFTFLIEMLGPYIAPGSYGGWIRQYHASMEELPMTTLTTNSKLFLLHQALPLDYPKVFMPHVIPTGPWTVGPAKNLSRAILDLMDDDVEGTIVFSMGSISSRLPMWMIHNFYTAFSQFNYTVIGRYNGVVPKLSTSNVKMLPWIPQNDLLGHKSTRLLVSHCGNNGMYEAIYHGIPIVGIPLFGDHYYNCQRLEYRGFGIVLNLQDFTAENLKRAMKTILSDPAYHMRVQKASAIFRRESGRPLDTAMHWITHYLDFGSDHLRSPAINFPWYKYYCLDTLPVIFLLFALALWCLISLLTCVCIKCLAIRVLVFGKYSIKAKDE